MSFAAVACAHRLLRGDAPAAQRAGIAHAGAVRRFGLYLLGLAFTTIVTTLATTPFTIYHFNRFPLYSVVANAIAVPITGFWVMPWAIAAVLDDAARHRERWRSCRCAGASTRSPRSRHTVTSWPGAVLHVPSPSSLALVLISLGGLWLCIWLGRWRWLGLGADRARPIAISR